MSRSVRCKRREAWAVAILSCCTFLFTFTSWVQFLFTFGISDILKIYRSAFSGETMNHWLSREQYHASHAAVLFEWIKSRLHIYLVGMNSRHFSFYKISCFISYRWICPKNPTTFEWMWTKVNDRTSCSLIFILEKASKNLISGRLALNWKKPFLVL